MSRSKRSTLKDKDKKSKKREDKGKHKAEDAKWYIPSFVREAAKKIKDAERRKKKAIEEN